MMSWEPAARIAPNKTCMKKCSVFVLCCIVWVWEGQYLLFDGNFLWKNVECDTFITACKSINRLRVILHYHHGHSQ